MQTRQDAIKWHVVMQQMYREGGLGAFYRGWLPLFCRDVPGYFLLFGVYEYGRELPQPLVGAAAGVAFYGSTLPIDRVKTIMMTQDLRRPKFASPMACARDIYRRDGLQRLLPGVAADITKDGVRPGRRADGLWVIAVNARPGVLFSLTLGATTTTEAFSIRAIESARTSTFQRARVIALF